MSLDIAATHSTGTGSALTDQSTATSMFPQSWFPLSVIYRFYSTSYDANSYYLIIRAASDRLLFRTETGGNIRFRTEGSSNENTNISANFANEWLTIGASWNSATERKFWVIRENGSISSSTQTSSITMSGAPQDVIYANQTCASLLGEVFMMHRPIEEHHVVQVSRGANIFNMPDLGRRVFHYKSLRHGYNDQGSVGVGVPANETMVASTNHPLIQPRIKPPIWLPATFSAGSTVSGTISEGAEGGDTFTSLYTTNPTITEGAEAGETYSVELTTIGTLSEGALAGDTFAPGLTTLVTVTDGAHAGETFAATIVGAGVVEGAITEGAQSGDTFANILTTQGIFAEGALAGDAFSASTTYSVLISEGAIAGDTMAFPTGVAYATGTLTVYSATSATLTIHNSTNGTTSINP